MHGVAENYEQTHTYQGCQTGAMALKIAPMNVFERQRSFYGRHVPANYYDIC